MTRDVTIAGSPCRAKMRAPAVVVVLSLVTLGIYTLYWWSLLMVSLSLGMDAYLRRRHPRSDDD